LVCESSMLEHCDEVQLDAFETAVNELQKAGVNIERGEIPELTEMTQLGPIMFPYEAYKQWGEAIENAPDKMFKPVLDRFLGGKHVTAEQDATARARMMELRKSYNQRTRFYDAVIAPTTPNRAPVIKPLMEDFGLFWDINLRSLSNTRIGNMFGLCALTLPTATIGAGFMLMSAPGSEEKLLQMGMAMEPVVAV
jgi:aspartyl-tRNA(Asn)/glutamyl-tRNA(Gln) amidotransferase subunit A